MLNVKHLISNILVLISATFHVSIVSQIQQNHPTSFKSTTYWKKKMECPVLFSAPSPLLFPLLRRRCFSVNLDHIWWHVLDGYSDSECISRTLYLYRKIFKTILMGLWINKCDVTHHSSLNSHCSRVTENQDNKEHAYKMARLLLLLFFVAFMGFTAQAILFGAGKVG